jgi:type IV secretory pathway VirB2 component (pilin)
MTFEQGAECLRLLEVCASWERGVVLALGVLIFLKAADLFGRYMS